MTGTRPETDGGADPGPAVDQKADLAPIFGHVAGLMVQSPHHKHLLLADLDWLVLPALMLGQYRLFRQDGRPVAFASWAFADEQTAARLTSPTPRLRPADWKSGDQAWLVDLVAPYGGADKVIGEVKRVVFPQTPLHVTRPGETGIPAIL